MSQWHFKPSPEWCRIMMRDFALCWKAAKQSKSSELVSIKELACHALRKAVEYREKSKGGTK